MFKKKVPHLLQLEKTAMLFRCEAPEDVLWSRKLHLPFDQHGG